MAQSESGERTAFVLAGGGSLGAVQVGMLAELIGAGVRPDVIVGVRLAPSMVLFWHQTQPQDGRADGGAMELHDHERSAGPVLALAPRPSGASRPHRKS